MARGNPLKVPFIGNSFTARNNVPPNSPYWTPPASKSKTSNKRPAVPAP
jgi:hypothetical protein